LVAEHTRDEVREMASDGCIPTQPTPPFRLARSFRSFRSFRSSFIKNAPRLLRSAHQQQQQIDQKNKKSSGLSFSEPVVESKRLEKLRLDHLEYMAKLQFERERLEQESEINAIKDKLDSER